jgi:uncharacterized membrane protein
LAEVVKETLRSVSLVFEVAGVFIIIAGFAYALVRSAHFALRQKRLAAYRVVRRLFGKSILLGIEVLVAADLIRTIAVEPTLANLYVLGLLVLIRTSLSWSLDVELEGVWPWQKRWIEDEEQRSGLMHSEGEAEQ